MGEFNLSVTVAGREEVFTGVGVGCAVVVHCGVVVVVVGGIVGSGGCGSGGSIVGDGGGGWTWWWLIVGAVLAVDGGHLRAKEKVLAGGAASVPSDCCE